MRIPAETGHQAMNIAELEAEVMKLDLSTRADLAEKLLRSLDSLTDAENEALWAEEAERRAEELRSGTVAALDGEDVLRQSDSMVRRTIRHDDRATG